MNHYCQRSASSLMATAMEHAVVNNKKNSRRFPSWRKLSSSSFNNSTTANSQRPRHFASKTNVKPNPSSSGSSNNNNAFQSILPAMSSASSSSSLSQERDTKIFFAVVPTLLAIGILLPDDWLAVITGNPLMAILTGFGMLGRENYMLEDNNKNGAAQEEHDAVVPRLLKSSTSSMSTASTTESSTCSTIASMNYAEDTLEIEGIQVPVGCEVNGTHLDRRGSALRCFAFFRGISIRVYVATLYSPRQLSNGLEILESLESHDASPLQMDFTFLRGFTAGQCKKAWEKQLDESVSYRYEGFEQDKADFLDMIATQPMKANGTVTVQILEDDDTITMMIFDQGTWTGEIVGKDFQRAFLSMWFGDKPVTDELKSGLLGQTL